jgi:hypothetical protein
MAMPAATKELVDNLLRDLANAPIPRKKVFIASHHGSEGSHVTVMHLGRKPASDDIEEWYRAPAARRKKLAATIAREIAVRADELRRRGVRNPVTQAEKEAAERWHHVSGAALNRWLRRNR